MGEVRTNDPVVAPEVRNPRLCTNACTLECGRRRMGGGKPFLLPQISCVRQSNAFIPFTGMDWRRLMQTLEPGARATFP